MKQPYTGLGVFAAHRPARNLYQIRSGYFYLIESGVGGVMMAVVLGGVKWPGLKGIIRSVSSAVIVSICFFSLLRFNSPPQ